MDDERPLYWLGSSLDDLRALLDRIKQRLKRAEAWYRKLTENGA